MLLFACFSFFLHLGVLKTCKILSPVCCQCNPDLCYFYWSSILSHTAEQLHLFGRVAGKLKSKARQKNMQKPSCRRNFWGNFGKTTRKKTRLFYKAHLNSETHTQEPPNKITMVISPHWSTISLRPPWFEVAILQDRSPPSPVLPGRSLKPGTLYLADSNYIIISNQNTIYTSTLNKPSAMLRFYLTKRWNWIHKALKFIIIIMLTFPENICISSLPLYSVLPRRKIAPPAPLHAPPKCQRIGVHRVTPWEKWWPHDNEDQKSTNFISFVSQNHEIWTHCIATLSQIKCKSIACRI